jgi:hypothetical protein
MARRVLELRRDENSRNRAGLYLKERVYREFTLERAGPQILRILKDELSKTTGSQHLALRPVSGK